MGLGDVLGLLLASSVYLSVSKHGQCLTSKETMRLIRDGREGGKGGMDVEGEGDYYIPIASDSGHWSH